MAAVGSIDRVDLLSCQEHNGVIMRLEKKAHVTGISATDHEALFDALEAAGIPKAQHNLDKDGLILVDRIPTMLNDIDQCDVVLIYENFFNDGQNFDDPPTGPFCGEARANIQQIVTNKDRQGDQIVLEHTYPADDPNFPGEKHKQTGEIHVYVPQRTLNVQGLKSTDTPWLVANLIIGRVNAFPWSLGGARTWMCTLATWKCVDPTTDANRYFMTFEFQHNPDGWDPTAVFIDEKTNRPPEGLVAEEGYKTITYQVGTDFDAVIGTLLQGA